MKRIVFSLCLLATALAVSAQTQVKNKNEKEAEPATPTCLYESKAYGEGSIIQPQGVELICVLRVAKGLEARGFDEKQVRNLMWQKTPTFSRN